MFRTIISHYQSFSTVLRRLIGLVSLALLMVIIARAQSRSVIDGTTPAGIAPGAPLGSYALSDFDNISFYTGSLNFHLPLLKVVGRGEAQYTMMLPIEQKWFTEHTYYGSEFQIPHYNWWDNIKPGYGPGVMHGRMVAESAPDCDVNPNLSVVARRVRLTFSLPDGTEYELRDSLYDGQTRNSTCNSPASRGTIFRTVDGTAATFVSNNPIFDPTGQGYSSVFYPSGSLMLRDGTHYLIDNGTITWLWDRNGNQISFLYDLNHRVTSIKDSLNRQITVAYDVNDGAPYGLCDRITFNGFGGAQRIIRISKTSLGSALRQSQPGDITTTQTYYDLFPQLNSGASSSTPHNPTVVSAVWLPNNGTPSNSTRYKFYYNQYGELARVELPTGGAYEYDWTGGFTNCSSRFFTLYFGSTRQKQDWPIKSGSAEPLALYQASCHWGRVTDHLTVKLLALKTDPFSH